MGSSSCHMGGLAIHLHASLHTPKSRAKLGSIPHPSNSKKATVAVSPPYPPLNKNLTSDRPASMSSREGCAKPEAQARHGMIRVLTKLMRSRVEAWVHRKSLRRRTAFLNENLGMVPLPSNSKRTPNKSRVGHVKKFQRAASCCDCSFGWLDAMKHLSGERLSENAASKVALALSAWSRSWHDPSGSSNKARSSMKICTLT